MKVLSLKEPYATLIKTGVKKIETRSWKTNYRGELYIHSSISKLSKDILNNKGLMNLVNIDDLKYGYIICKCNLIDCVYMTEEFIKEIKKNKREFICGEYSIGRYAWILSDIEIIEPIQAKGSLGIWNYKE